MTQHFKDIQFEFAGHIRNPEGVPLREDVEDRRMSIYRDLFYNNIEGFVSSSFPVLRKLYNDEDWHSLIRLFMTHHRAHSPYFLEISEEFMTYLQNTHTPRECDPPFMQELCHYEWVELALNVSDETNDLNHIHPNGDVMAEPPVMSSLAWNLHYAYPVHTLGPDNQPEQAPEQPTHIIVYRNRNDEVKFVLINAITAHLLTLLEQDETLTGQQACALIAEQIPQLDANVIEQGGRQTLQDLHAKGIILGTRKSA